MDMEVARKESQVEKVAYSAVQNFGIYLPSLFL